MSHHVLSILLFFAANPLASAADLQKYRLQHQWEAGKVYHFETSFEMENLLNGAPVGSMSTVLRFDAAVTQEAASERKLVAIKITDVKVLLNAGGTMTMYDSARPEQSTPGSQAQFGVMTGKEFEFTWIYNKDDRYVDVILQPALTQGGQDARGMSDALRQEFDFGVPREGMALGDSLSLTKQSGSNMFGPIMSKMEGRLDSIVEHKGRRHAKIVMDGHTVMKDQNGSDAPQAGTKNSAEILFDLERKRVTRHATKEFSNRPPGNETGKMDRITTLRGVEDMKVAQ